MSFHVPNKYRIRRGPIGSDDSIGNAGAFAVPHKKARFMVIASDSIGWEHVSVSMPDRCPTWKEMCLIKDLFWDPEDTVIQYHPAESEYVNNHPFCLHLWRPVGLDLPIPPSILVGVK